MSQHFLIFFSAAVVTNFVLVYFLGLCPVIGVTNKSATGFRLGLATTFVMVLASIAAWVMNFVLVRAPYLRIIAVIVAIASIVQLVELFIKKFSPSLYRELGGMRMPTLAEVYWDLPEGRHTYWRGEVVSAVALEAPFEPGG